MHSKECFGSATVLIYYGYNIREQSSSINLFDLYQTVHSRTPSVIDIIRGVEVSPAGGGVQSIA